MSDELYIDAAGRFSQPPEALRQRLAQHAGSFRVLAIGPGLLVGLRRGGQSLGAELPQLESATPVLAGDLAAIPPSDLISLLHQSRRTGILLTSSGGVERCAVLIDGQVTWVGSTSPTERLVVEQVEARAEDLWKQLDEKAIEIVFGLLAAESGTFTFLRPVDGARLPAVFALDTQAVLLDGLRRIDEVKFYRSRVTATMRPQRVQSSVPPSGAEVTPQALRLLELADGGHTISELAAATGLGEFAAIRACYHFVISGHLRPDPDALPEAATAAEAARAAQSDGLDPALSAL